MRKKLLFWVFLSGLAAGCVREDGRGEKQSGDQVFSLSDARDYFENLPRTRAETGADECNTLNPGQVAPLWQQGEVLPGKSISSVRVPVANDLDYKIVVDTDEGERILIPLISQLNVVCDINDGRKSAYMMYYAPLIDCLAPPVPDEERDLNHAYSGLVYCTTLSGLPVGVFFYRGGTLIQSAWLGDERYSLEENWFRMHDLSGGRKVAALSATATRGTRGDIMIAPVEVVGKKQTVQIRYIYSAHIGPDEKEVAPSENCSVDGGDEDTGGGSNGGGGGNVGPLWPQPEIDSEINPNLHTTDSMVVNILSDLNEDCMGKKLISSFDRTIRIDVIPGNGSEYHREVAGGVVVSESIRVGSDCPPVGLIEELMHAYQNRNNIGGNNHALNDEIEAKIGWALYVKKEEGDLAAYNKYLGGTQGLNAFYGMCDLHEFGFSILDSSSTFVKDAYLDIVDIFRGPGSPYRDPVKYPFDSKRISLDDLKNLMADC